MIYYKIVRFFINIIIYFLLVLGAYWGTLLAILSFTEFFRTIAYSINLIQAILGLVGFLLIYNSYYYYKKIKKFKPWYLLKNFF